MAERDHLTDEQAPEKNEISDSTKIEEKTLQETQLECEEGCDRISLEKLLDRAGVSKNTKGYNELPLVEAADALHYSIHHLEHGRIDVLKLDMTSFAVKHLVDFIRSRKDIKVEPESLN